MEEVVPIQEETMETTVAAATGILFQVEIQAMELAVEEEEGEVVVVVEHILLRGGSILDTLLGLFREQVLR
jgi:hypothetical protein